MAFAVVFLVNGIFVYVALRSNSGVVTENAYEKGLDYNATLLLAKKQQALGWSHTISYEHGTLRISLKDKNGQSITGAEVIACIERPIESEVTIKNPLSETRDGEYSADIPLPKSGQWKFTVDIIWKQQHYQISKRLVVN